MKVVSVFTATRAEYHLMYSVIKKINDDPDLCLDLIVSGTHLCNLYGHTVDQIVADGFPISEKISILNENGSSDIDEAIAKTLLGCSQHFKKIHSDMLIVLGDRYEIMGVVIAAANALIPIAHIHGGETTEGAIDEAVRHATTKFSYLHFACCETYRKRIIQLGENPNRVFNTGALGVENILKQNLLPLRELERQLDFNLEKFGLVTFHPVTLEGFDCTNQVSELMEALLETKDMTFIITKANADAGGSEINLILDQYGQNYPNKFRVVYSLGMIRYLSAMKYCKMVIGNSSSGILEAPTFRKPTINIGNRQKGRIQAESIINCSPNKEEIERAINRGLSCEFNESISNMKSIYGTGQASTIIVREIKKALKRGINLEKKFYDIQFEIQEEK